jgi:hypothetical protein
MDGMSVGQTLTENIKLTYMLVSLLLIAMSMVKEYIKLSNICVAVVRGKSK